MIYNPYMFQPMPQQMAQPIQQNSVKTVNTFDEVTANDVPMNVPYSVFVKSDLSEVQLRHWNSQGQIETLGFNAVRIQKPADDIREEVQKLSDKIDEISSLLRRDKNEPTSNAANVPAKQSCNAKQSNS